MKRSLFVIGILLVLCFGFSACGDKPVDDPNAETEITSIVGDWLCVEMTMNDGTAEMTTEDMENVFGAVKDIADLKAFADGTAELFLFDETLALTWTESGDGYVLTAESAGSESITAALKDGRLELVMEESMDDGAKTSFTMVFDYEGNASVLIDGWDLTMTEEESRLMNNAMVYGEFIVVDGYLYGTYGGDTVGAGTFSVAKVNGIELSDVKAMDINGNIAQLCEKDGVVYGVLDCGKILKWNVGDIKTEMIYEGYCDYLQVVGDRLYFSDENYHFCSMTLDGKDIKTVIEKEVYYPYVLSNWMILYQDDDDNESLHVYDPAKDADYKLNDVVSYCPVIYGDYLYYVEVVDDSGYGVMHRMDLYSGEDIAAPGQDYGYDYFIEEDTLFVSNGGIPALELQYWDQLSEAIYAGLVMTPRYSNGETRIYTTDDGERYITDDLFHIRENQASIGFYAQ